MDYKELEQKVIRWGQKRQLTHYRYMLESWPQYEKVQEEVGEIGRALAHAKKEDLIDGLGDTLVTLILLAKQNGLELTDCLAAAYEEIKDRKGTVVDGKFVKENKPYQI